MRAALKKFSASREKEGRVRAPVVEEAASLEEEERIKGDLFSRPSPTPTEEEEQEHPATSSQVERGASPNISPIQSPVKRIGGQEVEETNQEDVDESRASVEDNIQYSTDSSEDEVKKEAVEKPQEVLGEQEELQGEKRAKTGLKEVEESQDLFQESLEEQEVCQEAVEEEEKQAAEENIVKEVEDKESVEDEIKDDNMKDNTEDHPQQSSPGRGLLPLEVPDLQAIATQEGQEASGSRSQEEELAGSSSPEADQVEAVAGPRSLTSGQEQEAAFRSLTPTPDQEEQSAPLGSSSLDRLLAGLQQVEEGLEAVGLEEAGLPATLAPNTTHSILTR